MKQGFVIAIDGPAAAGKGTIVQLLSKHFKGINIYTGGMYRALALASLNKGISLQDEKAVSQVLENIKLDLGDSLEEHSHATIMLNGRDITTEIRTPSIALGAGKVAQMQSVRDVMLKMQRELAERFVEKGRVVIIDGQDTANYVYPTAQIKIFLTASQKERAARRLRQYEKQGIKASREKMLAEIVERDEKDFSRKAHPLSKDPKKDGYFYLDSSDMDEHKTLEIILDYIRRQGIL